LSRARPAVLACAALLAAGCTSFRPSVTVSPALRGWPDARVAVLPFDNQSTDLGAADVMRRLAVEEFSKRGYQPLPLEEVDGKLAGLGVSEGGQLPSVKPEDLAKALGADLLCYGDVQDFTFQNLGFVIRKNVALNVRLLAVSTGETLYEATGVGQDIKIYTNKDEAKKAFVEQLAVRLVQNLLKSPLRKEAEAAAWKTLDGLPRRQ
jgi:hypothetical protein